MGHSASPYVELRPDARRWAPGASARLRRVFLMSRPCPIIVTLSAVTKIAKPGRMTEERCPLHVGLGVEQHRPPVGVRRLDAEAEVGQGPDGDQLVPEAQEPHREHRTDGVRDDVPEDDVGLRGAQDLSRLDVVLGVDLERQAPHQAGEGRPAGDGQRGDQGAVAGAEDGDQEQGDDHVGEADQHVDGAHHQLVEPAAPAGGEGPDDDARHGTDDQGDGGDRHREPAAPHQPGQHVPAEVVGAEPVLAGGAGQPVGQVLGRRVVGGDPRGEQQDQQDRREQHDADVERPVNGPAPRGAASSSTFGRCGCADRSDVGRWWRRARLRQRAQAWLATLIDGLRTP